MIVIGFPLSTVPPILNSPGGVDNQIVEQDRCQYLKPCETVVGFVMTSGDSSKVFSAGHTTVVRVKRTARPHPLIAAWPRQM